MVSDAQKKATKKYRKEKLAQRTIYFSPNEKELLDHLDAQNNKGGYIKQLIRADIEGRVKWD